MQKQVISTRKSSSPCRYLIQQRFQNDDEQTTTTKTCGQVKLLKQHRLQSHATFARNFLISIWPLKSIRKNVWANVRHAVYRTRTNNLTRLRQESNQLSYGVTQTTQTLWQLNSDLQSLNKYFRTILIASTSIVNLCLLLIFITSMLQQYTESHVFGLISIMIGWCSNIGTVGIFILRLILPAELCDEKVSLIFIIHKEGNEFKISDKERSGEKSMNKNDLE